MQRGAEEATVILNPTTNGKMGRIRHVICPGTMSRQLNIRHSNSATEESEEERRTSQVLEFAAGSRKCKNKSA